MLNDFTKEELIIIKNVLKFGLDNCVDDLIEPMKHLLSRFESMIDNYCEHREHGEVEIFVDVCGTCDALMLRDKTLREYNE